MSILQQAATFREFERVQFFSKNLSLLAKKTRILNVLRIPTFPVAFYGKFAHIRSKKIHVQQREQTSDVAAMQLAKTG